MCFYSNNNAIFIDICSWQNVLSFYDQEQWIVKERERKCEREREKVWNIRERERERERGEKRERQREGREFKFLVSVCMCWSVVICIYHNIYFETVFILRSSVDIAPYFTISTDSFLHIYFVVTMSHSKFYQDQSTDSQSREFVEDLFYLDTSSI